MELDPDACYSALKARDARFDGRFYIGVTSTGIYCRPVCRVKVPKRDNCRFFGHAALAESAGFRPCLRCRPELAPRAGLAWSIHDASQTLALQAARLLDEPQAWGEEQPSVERLAARLGISERHLRRIFEAQFGVAPIQYLQTRRLLSAKQLLTDTTLPMTQIALISGYASLRRFNAAFAEHYRINPTRLRREGRDGAGSSSHGIVVRLAYRPPYDVGAMLAFFARRALTGLEWVQPDEALPALAFGVRLSAKGGEARGWLQARFDEGRHQLVLTISDSLREQLPLVIWRVRALLDLDADPQAIDAQLAPHFAHGAGLRVPGALDGFELAVRAILGQQVTVAAGRTLAQRLLDALGEPLATPFHELCRLFPAPAVLAALPPDRLGELGIVKQRQAAIQGLAQAVAAGRLALHAGVEVNATMAALKALPGIGDWTAQYIAMRALRWPDAFPGGDVALQKAMGIARGARSAAQAEAAAQSWRPWRSYAVIRCWAGLEPAPPKTNTKGKDHEI